MRQIADIRGKLLEGCVWDEEKQNLYFVDIDFRKIYQYHPESANLTQIRLHTWVSCVAVERDGGLIAGLADGLYRVDMETGTYVRFLESGLPEGYRYNDGKCDSAGRLWVGSMAMDEEERARFGGSLFGIGQNGIVREYGGYSIPNGMCWGGGGRRFYHIDTPTRRVDVYDVDGDRLRNRRMAVSLDREPGVPDGMCMDGEGNLWIAMWGAGQILCCDPENGRVRDRLEVPDLLVSCCTFGGRDMDRLYVTTARDDTGAGGEVYEYEMQTRGVYGYRYGESEEKDGADHGRGKGNRTSDCLGDGGGRI